MHRVSGCRQQRRPRSAAARGGLECLRRPGAPVAPGLAAWCQAPAHDAARPQVRGCLRGACDAESKHDVSRTELVHSRLADVQAADATSNLAALRSLMADRDVTKARQGGGVAPRRQALRTRLGELTLASSPPNRWWSSPQSCSARSSPSAWCAVARTALLSWTHIPSFCLQDAPADGPPAHQLPPLRRRPDGLQPPAAAADSHQRRHD